MFELTAGHLDRPFRDRRPIPTIFSFVAHVAAITAVISAFFFIVDNVPKVPTMVSFVAELPAPPPAPPPPPAPRAARAQTQPASKPDPIPSQPTFAAPVETPATIQPESSLVTTPEVSVPGGMEGGIPGGVAGGVPGGLVGNVAPPPPVAKTPVRVGGDIRTPKLIRRVEPMYPQMAVNAKVTGIVILEATVDEKGTVTNVTVLRSLPVLDQAAIAAVRQWRYEPLMMNGAPFPFMLTVTLTFSIR